MCALRHHARMNMRLRSPCGPALRRAFAWRWRPWLPTLLAGIAAAPTAAEPLSYELDPAHSWLHFEVMHFGTSTIRGRIGPFQGHVLLDRAAGRGEVSLAVRTATVDTGLGFFNARLRQDDLLASEAFPEAYFVSNRFRFENGRLADLRGEFTWRGVGQPLTLTAQRFACRNEGAAAARAEVCGGDFEGELLRSDFGATFGLPLVANRVRLLVQVEGRRPNP
jgi:polyisoprenoid-binding protein YceI